MQGRIIRGIAGFYYVSVPGSGVYECKAKGIFRKEGQKPLVGDLVEIEVLSEDPKEGSVCSILPRVNELIRPAVANIDGALVIFAYRSPKPNRNLLDRFLISMERSDIRTAVCFNKRDLVSEEEAQDLERIYTSAGYRVFPVCVKTGEGIEGVREFLDGKVVTVAGPSGVGKSSLINKLQEGVHMETGSVSEKIDRGKHTTRHSELISIGENSYICDTPGFSSLYLPGLAPEDLWRFFPEFIEHEKYCRFQGCMHHHEPDCGIKAAVAAGEIVRERYESYLELLQQIKEGGRRQ